MIEPGSEKRGPSGISADFVLSKFKKRLNQDFAYFYNRVKLLLTCNTIKGENSSDRIK